MTCRAARTTSAPSARGVHGNRLIAHQVFQDLGDGVLTDPSTDLEDGLAKVPNLVKASYSGTADVINKEYASNYLASLFKNATRCRDVVTKVRAVGLTP